ncbi:pyruvate, phosphate dikinase [Actinoplanes sp. NPDC026670]|uniref:pyruvate, phosphate dikinase n=1 Tax=Actinoplanes sp. NPDC026670 TaxID=3154700 RepID=UPI0034048D1C
MSRYVFDFSDGNKDLKELLGGKGANLAEMTRMGLPVPPGFTITTDACREYLHTGALPAGLLREVEDHLRLIEARLGKRFGDLHDPLLLSVRSGGPFSMPGMMETILDLGLNDTTVRALAARTGDERFAWDSYRRLIQMFGRTVYGVPDESFEAAPGSDLDAAALRDLVAAHQKVFAAHTGRDFPQSPHEQLYAAITAVFQSWNADRAVLYRRQERIPHDLGTAVNVQAMVFGNRGPGSGSGVAFTRDPATGRRGAYGDYLPNAQGEDVVAGIRNTMALADLARIDPASHVKLLSIMEKLEQRFRDLCDIEFTIEDGELWMLQTRVGKRTPAAAFVIAAQLVDEGTITLDEALGRVTGDQLAHLMFPGFDLGAAPKPLTTGVAASPGAASGTIVFDSAAAAAATGPVILVRHETNPDDLPGMIAAEGILTSRGGKTSHAAVVARGMGRTCVCGADEAVVDPVAGTLTVGSTVLRAGDVISIDGTTGRVYAGAVPVQPSPVVRFFEGELTSLGNPLLAAVQRLITHAGHVARLGVHANADTAADARRARLFGAGGIGLCRTEHMFLGPRRELVEHLILADSDEEREAALAQLLPLQRDDFTDLLREMDGLPVTIRLLDPPLHEFLPSLEELTARVATERDRLLLAAVRRMHEQNPMLGLRGVRLGLVVPGLFAMQVRAVAEAAAARAATGGDPRPEIMVPLVGTVQELDVVRAEALEILSRVEGAPPIPIGTMIEVPRAALTAGDIAHAADFFSFGTNDLTQMTWGFSRDDVEGAFFGRYLDLGIFAVSPFESLDVTGVGELVRTAVERGRATRPGLPTGVCGEHGGDPASIRFFHDVGLDYVSCSPFRIPVARLEAGRAAVTRTADSSR